MPKITTIETSGPLPVSTIVFSLIVSLITIHGSRLVCIIDPIPITSIVSLWAVPSTTTVISIPKSSLASPASASPTRIL
ncbi:hypothetical protein HanRHA438_Chr05g0212071 [Helianthus annuus]|nr:hypothetical protein HanRHA438_Chr05g0212071 [Helianthus annuus]